MKNFDIIKFKSQDISAQALSSQQTRTFERCKNIMLHLHTDHPITFSHFTALELLGVELPVFDTKSNLRLGCLDHEKLQASSSLKSQRYWQNGIQWHYAARPLPTVKIAGQILCTSPATTWAQLSPWIDAEELIILGDSLMRRDQRLKRASPSDFSNYLLTNKSFIGRSRCLNALPSLHADTDSSQETRLRLKMESHGFTGAIPNLKMINPFSERPIYFDLAYPELKFVLEYNGKQHNDPHQRQRDDDKRHILEIHGWKLFEVKAEDLNDIFHWNILIARIIAQVGTPE